MCFRIVGSALVLGSVAFSALAEEGREEVKTARSAVCAWAEAPPKLDGKLDDPCWKQARPIQDFAAFWAGEPRRGTKALLAWDHDALYYAATMTDAELIAAGSKRNDHLWEGDVFEIFLKPSPDRQEYYEFQANPRAVVFEVAFARRGPLGHPFHEEPVLGNEAVAAVDGTLNHAGDVDRGWTVEGRIPWTAFRLTGGAPQPGASWSFALCRFDYGPEGTRPLMMSCAPLTQPNYHRYEDYGRLTFEGPKRAAPK